MCAFSDVLYVLLDELSRAGWGSHYIRCAPGGEEGLKSVVVHQKVPERSTLRDRMAIRDREH